MKNTLIRKLPGIAVVALLVILGVSVVNQVGQTPEVAKYVESGIRKTKVLLPKGKQVYAIAQAADVWPRLVEATIDPVDTHLGAEQTLEVIVESQQPIDRVYAKIETDSGYYELELNEIGDAPIASPHPSFEKFVYSNPPQAIQAAYAQEQTIRKLYRNSWIVDDVHDRKYETTFIAIAGEDTSEVTLTWSDACGIPTGGNWTLEGKSNNCTISADDGVDNGDIIIDGGNTLTLNADFAWNSGKTLTITDGAIALCSTCELRQTNIWQTDQDQDAYPLSSIMTLQDTAPTNGRRRNLLQIALDCDDTDPNVFPNQPNYFSGQAAGGGYDYNCDSAETPQTSQIGINNCTAGNNCEQAGWQNSVPACGALGTYILADCNPDPEQANQCNREFRQQTCR